MWKPPSACVMRMGKLLRSVETKLTFAIMLLVQFGVVCFRQSLPTLLRWLLGKRESNLTPLCPLRKT